MSRCVKATCPLCDCCTSSPHGGGMPEKPHGSILRRAGPLMLARLGVAAFTFAIPMVLARVLLPESYGTFKQAWLLSTTLVLVLPLGLNQSLVYFVPREPTKKRLWESHALVLTTALGAVAAALLLGLGPLVASAFHNPELTRVMPYVAAFTAMRLAASCFDLALMAKGRIPASAAVRLASEGFYTLCLIAGALWTHSVAGAFAGVVIATSAKAAACSIALAGGALRLFREAVARLSFVFVPTMALLAIAAPALISFLFTDRYLGAVPIFRVAILSIPMAALPLDGVMRARAQNQFMFRVSALKLVLTVPLVWAGLKLWGPIGALGGWICAEEICRFILLRRAARLFGTGILGALPRELWLQAAAAAIAAAPGALVMHFAAGPRLIQLCSTGIAFALAYLAALRAMGVLPPVRDWIPQKTPQLMVREAA